MSSAIAVFAPAAAVFACSPGAGNFLAMRNGARYGARPAIIGFAGRLASFVVLFLAVAVGLGSLIAASETALTVIKWCGVTYLVWLGAQTLWNSRRRTEVPDAVAPTTSSPATSAASDPPQPPAAPMPLARIARQEFLTSITNPKALLLVSAFLPQFVVPGADPVAQLVVLGGAYILLEFVAACGWAGLGQALSSRRLTASLRRRFGQLTGLLMIGTGGWLATFSARSATA